MKAISIGSVLSLLLVLGYFLLPDYPGVGIGLLAGGAAGVFFLLLLLSTEPLLAILQTFPILLVRFGNRMFYGWMAAFMLVWLLELWLRPSGKSRPLPRFIWPLAPIVVISLLAWTRSLHPDTAMLRLLTTVVVPTAIFLAILRMPDDSHVEVRLPRLAYWAFAGIGLLSLIYKLLHPETPRVAGFYQMSVTMVGYGAAALIPLGLYYVETGRRRWLEGLLFTLVALALLLTNTRMAFLMAGASLAVNYRRLRHMLWLMVPLVLIGAILGASLLFARFEDLSQETFDYSSASRLMAWYSGLKLVLAQPWMGIGFDNFHDAYLAITPAPFIKLLHSHNVLLQLMVDLGIPGMLIYVGLVGRILFRHWRGRGALGQALGWMLTIYLMAGATDAIFYYPLWAVYFWLLLACHLRLDPQPEVVQIHVRIAESTPSVVSG